MFQFFPCDLLKPDESMADDFLFPMTSRASYASSAADSDGEFCEPETPSISRQPSRIEHHQPPGLDRHNSDPNLNVSKGSNGIIPDYNAPPPHSITISPKQKVYYSVDATWHVFYDGHFSHIFLQDLTSPRRRSPDRYNQYQSLPIQPNTSSHLESSPAPRTTATTTTTPTSTPRTSSTSSANKRSQSQPPHAQHQPLYQPPPVVNGLPPQIERTKKPSKVRDGYHTYNAHRSPSANHNHLNGNIGYYNSLDRKGHTREMKMVCYL